MNVYPQVVAPLFLMLFVSFTFLSCKSDGVRPHIDNQETRIDTLLQKQESDTAKFASYDVFKSIRYYAVAGMDTIGARIHVDQSKSDGKISIDFRHHKPISFDDLLHWFKKFLPLINNDFELSKLTYLHFDTPLFYKDISSELSAEYQKRYGKESINWELQVSLLMESSLRMKLDSLFSPYRRKVLRIDVEKFHLTKKEYYREYFPEENLSEYPEVAIDGIMTNVLLEQN